MGLRPFILKQFGQSITFQMLLGHFPFLKFFSQHKCLEEYLLKKKRHLIFCVYIFLHLELIIIN